MSRDRLKYVRPEIFNLAGADEAVYGACGDGYKGSGPCAKGSQPTVGYCQNGTKANVCSTYGDCQSGGTNNYECLSGTIARGYCCKTGYYPVNPVCSSGGTPSGCVAGFTVN